jgi:hypothetical protein
MNPGSPEALPSSLASYRQTVTSDEGTPEPDQRGCERMRGWSFLNAETGQIVPARCSRNGCSYCLRANARRRARAIAWASPDRAILLTLVGDNFAQIRERMKVLRYRLALEVEDVRWLWHVEPNPQDTGHHVHAWQRGSYVPQRLLSERARSVGMGSFARVNQIRSRKGAAAYGLKGLGYGLKNVTGSDDEGMTYLRENGYRLTHQSRGFFQSASGATMGVRDAEKVATATEGAGSWVLVRQGSDGLMTGPA